MKAWFLVILGIFLLNATFEDWIDNQFPNMPWRFIAGGILIYIGMTMTGKSPKSLLKQLQSKIS